MPSPTTPSIPCSPAPWEGHVTKQVVDAGKPGVNLAAKKLTWLFERDARGQVSQAREPTGGITTWTWDLFGGTQWSEQVNPAGWVTEQDVDVLGRVDHTTGENGEQTRTTYDGLGRPVNTYTTGAPVPGTAPVELLRSTNVYTEADLNLDPWLGGTPAYVSTTSHLYDEDGDALGTLTSHAVSEGTGSTSSTWTPHEDGGWRVAFSYDGISGQPMAQGVQEVSGVFDAGLPPTFAFIDSSTDYDGLGEPIRRFSRDSDQTDITYPAPGLTQEYQQSADVFQEIVNCNLQRTKRYQSDIHGRLVEVKEGEVVATLLTTGTYRYDGRARVAEFADANNNKWRYRYDGAGRSLEVERKGPNTSANVWARFEYNKPYPSALGPGAWPTKMAIGEDLANLSVSEWTYDVLGRTINKTLTPGHDGTPDLFEWQWDAEWLGARDRIRFPMPNGATGKVDYDYDAQNKLGGRGLVVSETQTLNLPGGAKVDTLSYVHDGQGRVVQSVWPEPGVPGKTVDLDTVFAFNGMMESQQLATAPFVSVDYSHDRWGQTETWNGMAGMAPFTGQVTRLGQNRVGQMDWTVDTAIHKTEYRYCGQDDRLESRRYEGGIILQFKYAYDHLERLETVKLNNTLTEQYDYDTAGNITAMNLFGNVAGVNGLAWTYPTPAQFSEVSQRARASAPAVYQSFGYDTAGRLSSAILPVPLGAQIHNYAYDGASRLMEVADPAVNGADTTYWYDNDDNIVLETRLGGGANGVITRFGPLQNRNGTTFSQILANITFENGDLRHTLSEPDGRAAWVLEADGTLVSEQITTSYGLEYHASAWGGVNTSEAWPLGGLHGAESAKGAGVMHFGARHMALRGDGMWMQPEPLLALGMTNGHLGMPRAYGGIYGMGNTNRFRDSGGQFPDVIWDVANISMGLASGAANLSVGNYSGAFVDGVGVAVDTAAALTPGVPGGAGTAIRLARGADKVADIVKVGNKGLDGAQLADKVMDGGKTASKAVKEGAEATAGRARNKLKPDPTAKGEHSTFKTDAKGKVSNHAEWSPNSKNPTGFDEVKRVDVTGRPHRNPDGTSVPTPHVKEAGVKGARPATPEELP